MVCTQMRMSSVLGGGSPRFKYSAGTRPMGIAISTGSPVRRLEAWGHCTKGVMG